MYSIVHLVPATVKEASSKLCLVVVDYRYSRAVESRMLVLLLEAVCLGV